MIENYSIAISVENLFFSYGDVPTLANLNAFVPRGEIWGLVGRSGSGKSTFLQIVAGLFRPTAGEVRVAGRESMESGQIRGVVFQGDSLLGWLSALENVTFPDRPKGDAEEVLLAAKVLLREVGLERDLLRYPHELSAGMRKRVEFARALLRDQEFFLADEPFGTLDALTRKQLWLVWRSVRKENRRTGFLCTHDPEEAIRLCDAVLPLVGSRPATFGRVVRVPESVRTLDLESTTEELNTLMHEVVNLL